jgi:lysozyme
MPRDSNVPPPAPTSPQGPKQRSGAGYAAAIAAACLVCAPLTATFEGKSNKPYLDPVKKPTVCYGETQVAMRVYSDDECGRMLRHALAQRYGPKIAACLPELTAADRRNEFVAMLDSSYNAGPAAICRSPMARQIRAGEWSAACSSLRSFYVGSVTARPVKGAMESRRITGGPNKGKWFNKFRGLVGRRAFFADFCMKPEPPPSALPVARAQLQMCVPLRPPPAPQPIVKPQRIILYPHNSEIA